MVGIMLYPATVAGVLAGHWFLTSLGLGVGVSAYLAVALGILWIAVVERLLPERREWRPDTTQAANDLTFLVLIQVMLPYGLALLAVAVIGDLSGQHGWRAGIPWPHHWPLVAQVALMLVVAEFFRYWLHRFGHTWPAIWRFHAVHHAPKLLYWLNVGRFHPVDKTLQFLGDSLPFILMGVAPEVVKFYFVFYAVNGFFQHSNCRVRLGPLNWIIAGPELHRWHHSKRVEESNTNYGNNLIIWDAVFGTRFLPKGREVGELGLMDETYPTGFASQMTAPLTRSGSGP